MFLYITYTSDINQSFGAWEIVHFIDFFGDSRTALDDFLELSEVALIRLIPALSLFLKVITFQSRHIQLPLTFIFFGSHHRLKFQSFHN